MFAVACTCLLNAVTKYTMASSASGLVIYACSQQLFLTMAMANAMATTWLAPFLAVVHMFLFHFYDAMWHGHCHGYWVPHPALQTALRVYGFVFDSGMTYDVVVEGHRVHHRYCDTPEDINVVFGLGMPKWTSYLRRQILRMNPFMAVVMQIIHTCMLYALVVPCDMPWMAVWIVLTGAFGRTSTIWPAHYCRGPQPHECKILKPSERTHTENSVVMFLAPGNFSHAYHHDNQSDIHLDPREVFDGHALYLALLGRCGLSWLLRPTCKPLRETDLQTFHSRYFAQLDRTKVL